MAWKRVRVYLWRCVQCDKLAHRARYVPPKRCKCGSVEFRYAGSYRKRKRAKRTN